MEDVPLTTFKLPSQAEILRRLLMHPRALAPLIEMDEINARQARSHQIHRPVAVRPVPVQPTTHSESNTPICDRPQNPKPQNPPPQNPVPQHPTPQNPVPQNLVPQNPAPQNLVPQNPAPQNPPPQNPVPQHPTPQNPVPQNLVPQNPAPQNPVPQHPTPQNSIPQNPTPHLVISTPPTSIGLPSTDELLERWKQREAAFPNPPSQTPRKRGRRPKNSPPVDDRIVNGTGNAAQMPPPPQFEMPLQTVPQPPINHIMMPNMDFSTLLPPPLLVHQVARCLQYMNTPFLQRLPLVNFPTFVPQPIPLHPHVKPEYDPYVLPPSPEHNWRIFVRKRSADANGEEEEETVNLPKVAKPNETGNGSGTDYMMGNASGVMPFGQGN